MTKGASSTQIGMAKGTSPAPKGMTKGTSPAPKGVTKEPSPAQRAVSRGSKGTLGTKESRGSSRAKGSVSPAVRRKF